MIRSEARVFVGVGLFSVLVYSLFMYGGIRSPDAEIVYRSAQTISKFQGTHVEEDLEAWEGFGVAEGRDGKLYSVFGPVQSFAAAPFVAAARGINQTGWYEHAPFYIPSSPYRTQTLQAVLNADDDAEPHAERFLVMFFNVLVTATCVFVLMLLLLRLGTSLAAVGVTGSLYAFGTLAWPYAETFFSEPLATLLSVSAFLLLVPKTSSVEPSVSHRHLAVSGALLGLAIGTHLTSVLFVPVFALYGIHRYPVWVPRLRGLLAWGLGLAGPIVALLAFNYMRFGDALETGRYVDPDQAKALYYGSFINPLKTLYYLLFSSGKGLVIYCPAIILGLAALPRMRRRNAQLALALLAMALIRLVFVASRSDWHGGDCVGPRYMVPLIPFLLVPVAFLFDEVLRTRRALWVWSLLGFVAVCTMQQLLLVMGRLPLFYRTLRDAARAGDVRIDGVWGLHSDWEFSPLKYMLQIPRAPYLLESVPLSSATIWIIGVAVILVVTWIVGRHVLMANTLTDAA